MRAFRPRVVHFIGHGAYPHQGPDDPGDVPPNDPVPLPGPALVLEGRHTATRRAHAYLSAGDFRALCRECGARVVVLNCCWGGRLDPHLTGVAQALTTPEGGWCVPVAVAMQCPVPQTTALMVADCVYRCLTGGSSFEFALQQFRIANVETHGLGRGFWGIPALFASVRDTVLFDMGPRSADRIDLLGELTREYTPLVGREFLSAEIDRFLGSRRSGRFLLTAPAGLGKSAFLVNWVGLHGHRARFFYRYSGQDSPLRCARALYSVLHETWCPGLPYEAPDRLEDAPQRLGDLLQQVSRRMPAGDSEVIVIDGLDEAVAPRPEAAVPLPEELPHGLFVLLAARPEWLGERPLPPEVEHYRLDPEGPDNLRDAARYLDDQLGFKEVSLKAEVRDRLVGQVEGNFLILRLVCDMLRPGTPAAEAERVFTDIRKLPDAYRVYWQRLAETAGADGLRRVDDVLGALLASRDPVTETQLAGVLGRPLPECRQALGHVRRFLSTALVPGEAVGYRFFHRSFRDFVVDRVGDSLRDQHLRWADHGERWRELTGYAQLYALRHLVSHLIAASKGA
jgi:hypothetical protein